MLKAIAARLRWLLDPTQGRGRLAAVEELSEPERARDYRLPGAWRGAPCELYLFRGWSGYVHPVFPVELLTHEAALQVPAFGRVYASIGGSPLMLAFELRLVWREALDDPTAAVGPGLYAAEPGPDDTTRRGPRITAAEAVTRDAYVRVLDGTAELVRNAFDYVFEYDYRPDGRLQRLTIRDDREVKVLDY